VTLRNLANASKANRPGMEGVRFRLTMPLTQNDVTPAG
jgi:hypothetical protein